MSKIGKAPIIIPESVNVSIEEGNIIVSGAKGTLKKQIPPEIEVKINSGQIEVGAKGDSKQVKSMHGTMRSLYANMVSGVTNGWEKRLELVGTGYRAEVADNTLSVNVGFSHPVKFSAPQGIEFKVEKNIIIISGIDKELVGQVTANIRAVKPPEPYKGKGIKYVDEVVRRKAGKSAKTAAA